MTERTLSALERARTQRQLILPELGMTGQTNLAHASVAVVGAGGLGSPVITYLAAAGVGRLTVFDDDTIDDSNLNRQFLHSIENIGAPKVDSVSARVREIAPECVVTVINERLTGQNAATLLSGFDVVVDGSDNFETRFVINDAAGQLGFPIVWGAVLAWSAQVTVLWPAPPAHRDVAAISLSDIFADTQQTRQTLSCSTAGVMGAMCGQAGSLMAMETIKLLAGVGTPLLGRMMVFDGLRAEHRTVKLRTPAEALIPTNPSALSDIPKNAVVVDVRFEHELLAKPADMEVIALPLERVLHIANPADDRASVLAGASTSTPIVTVCAEGPRSIKAARHLIARGFPVAGFLDGGLP
jgi:adenylyltransferase/sulfurtransferase